MSLIPGDKKEQLRKEFKEKLEGSVKIVSSRKNLNADSAPILGS